MTNATDYLEKNVASHIFGGPDYTRPTVVYIGLSTTTIAEDGSGITEPSVSVAYDRVSANNDLTVWSSIDDPGGKYNVVELTFPNPTGAWGDVTDWFISDAAVGGNIMFKKAFAGPRTINENTSPVRFLPGNLVLNVD